MAMPNYAENVNNAPYGLQNTNAPGSPYAAAFGRGTTTHLMLPVDPIIFDAQPKQFLDLQFLMAFASKENPSDELIWQENVWSRTPIVTRASFAGTALSPGVSVTGTIPITAATLEYVFEGQQLYYRGTDGVYAQCVVASVTSTSGSEAIVVRSQRGRPLPPLASGAEITNGLTLGGDGQSAFTQPTRLRTVQRTNLIEKIGPEQKLWNKMERIKWRNLSQTNFIEQDMRDMLTQLKVSLCQRIWIGNYGENTTLQGAIAKNTEGIVPAILNNGGALLNSTMSTVWDDITTGIFATNFGPVSNESVIFGTPEMLNAINMKQKAELVRYAPGDTTSSADFEVWRFGGQTVTLVPVQIWNDSASFPAEYKRRLVVLKKDSIKLATMRGIPMLQQEVKVSQSRSNITPFEIYDFERFTVEGMVGTELKNAAQHFIVDVE